MALAVENGTIVTDAESYISVEDASTYHGNRGNTAWAAKSDGEKEQLLRKATDYMQQFYRTKWKGYRKTPGQSLDWPREGVPVMDSMPDVVLDAAISSNPAYWGFDASGTILGFDVPVGMTVSTNRPRWPQPNLAVNADADVVMAPSSWVANNVVPTEVKRACAELALRAINEDLAPDLGRRTASESVAGAISVSYEKGTAPQYKRFRAVDLLLKPYLDTYIGG